MTKWEISRLLRQVVRRALSLRRYRRQLPDRALGVGAALTTKLLGLRRNLIADVHRRRTFQSIYRDHLWGVDDTRCYFSGVGSRGEQAARYVATMAPLLQQHAGQEPEELVVVDLGCGDFTIGSTLLESLDGVRYIGCDIVPELIAYNQGNFGSETVEFRTIDIVRDLLPGGHVCLLRQVLQHLSNAEIAMILPKLASYKYVYVSEDQALVSEGMPNPDKPVGADIRFDWRTGHGRGVELYLPPWNLMLEEVSQSSSTGLVKARIVTHRIIFPDRLANTGGAGDRPIQFRSRT